MPSEKSARIIVPGFCIVLRSSPKGIYILVWRHLNSSSFSHLHKLRFASFCFPLLGSPPIGECSPETARPVRLTSHSLPHLECSHQSHPVNNGTQRHYTLPIKASSELPRQMSCDVATPKNLFDINRGWVINSEQHISSPFNLYA
jgi:hypothetical protein